MKFILLLFILTLFSCNLKTENIANENLTFENVSSKNFAEKIVSDTTSILRIKNLRPKEFIEICEKNYKENSKLNFVTFSGDFEENWVTKNDLEYLDYTLEIETLSDKNILSANNQIYISKISFLKNFYFSLDDQEINPDLNFKSIGGLR
jgi:hypothetical protein